MTVSNVILALAKKHNVPLDVAYCYAWYVKKVFLYGLTRPEWWDQYAMNGLRHALPLASYRDLFVIEVYDHMREFTALQGSKA